MNEENEEEAKRGREKLHGRACDDLQIKLYGIYELLLKRGDIFIYRFVILFIEHILFHNLRRYIITKRRKVCVESVIKFTSLEDGFNVDTFIT